MVAAIRPRPPLRLGALPLAGLGIVLGLQHLLAHEFDAPRFSDSRITAERSTNADPDLDGDGLPDRFDGIFESCGDRGCAYEVYLRRPDGDQYVGRMEGYWPFRIDRIPGMPADVVAGPTRYRFAGNTYYPLP